MTAVRLIAGVVLLAANAAFVAVQFALVASRRTVLEGKAAAGDRRARRALAAVADLDPRLTGSQLGITMASLGLGAVTVPALGSVLGAGLEAVGGASPRVADAVGTGVGLVAVVFLHVVVGELVPKAVAITHPEPVLLALSGFERAYTAVFGPVARGLGAAARGLGRLLGARSARLTVTGPTAEELSRLLAESRRRGVLEETAHDLLAGALDLGGRTLRSVLVPAAEVVSVPRTATVAEAEAAIAASGVSRLLVTGAGDVVVGFVRPKDLVAVPAEARHRPLPVSRIRRVLVLSPDLSLDTVLVAMRRSRAHVASVSDGGGFEGIVTLEDVLGSLVRPSTPGTPGTSGTSGTSGTPGPAEGTPGTIPPTSPERPRRVTGSQ